MTKDQVPEDRLVGNSRSLTRQTEQFLPIPPPRVPLPLTL